MSKALRSVSQNIHLDRRIAESGDRIAVGAWCRGAARPSSARSKPHFNLFLSSQLLVFASQT
jgi:hypothetical protein